ncbi:MAG: alanine racemase [bacterium]
MSSGNYTSWIEISRSAYKKNIDFFRSRTTQGVEIAVVIKANGYGHGIIETARIAEECNISIFCVHSLEEGLNLRKAGFDQRIIVLGPVMVNALNVVVENDLEIVCYLVENLKNLEKNCALLNKTAQIHLKIETGTNRQGISGQALLQFVRELKNCSHLELKAVFSHFANIEDTTDHSYAKEQMERFQQELNLIREEGFRGFDLHFASSAAAAIYPKTHFSMVRLGISQFGLWPSKETYLSYITEHGHGIEHILNPVMTWKTVVSQIKSVKSGEFVGYGCTHQVTRDSKIAVLPIGYSDGYDRKLSNQGYVLIRGKRAPVVGRVAMNLTTVDVTDIADVTVEDEVVLIGKQGNQIIRAEDLAAFTGTINYEVVSRIGSHIPRIVV